MTYRPKDSKERILHRLKIAQGHLKKVIQMVDDDAYCIDVDVYKRQQDLKLFTVYSPPEHADGTIHVTKADAQKAEGHE